MTLSDAVAHLSPHRWARANRLLIRKALAEFAHERLLTPEATGDGRHKPDLVAQCYRRAFALGDFADARVDRG